MTVSKEGKVFEQFIMSELHDIQETQPIFYHRMADSHTAGKFIAPQPCDLILCTETAGTLFIELKVSEVKKSLAESPRDAFRPSQIGKMKLLRRAGQEILCVFYSRVSDLIEVWNIGGCLDEITENRLPAGRLISRFPPEDFEKFVLTLCS